MIQDTIGGANNATSGYFLVYLEKSFAMSMGYKVVTDLISKELQVLIYYKIFKIFQDIMPLITYYIRINVIIELLLFST